MKSMPPPKSFIKTLNTSNQRSVMMLNIFGALIFITAFFAASTYAQEGANQEFSAYVFKAINLPYKGRNYAGDFFNQDVAYVQSPLAAPFAKGPAYAKPIKLPTIRPYTVKWSNLNDVRINNENAWNFEKRIDSKVWWP